MGTKDFDLHKDCGHRSSSRRTDASKATTSRDVNSHCGNFEGEKRDIQWHIS
jgi:hypothetical protein